MNKTSHPLYTCYHNMIRRCYDTNHYNYKNYGGRGIKVCDRWLNNFWDFVNDMGDKPSGDYSLDRIDNNKEYSPDNCRWADRKTQANNRRSQTMIEYQGVCKSLSVWSRELGFKYVTLKKRLDKNPGISPEKLFEKPLDKYGSHVTIEYRKENDRRKGK